MTVSAYTINYETWNGGGNTEKAITISCTLVPSMDTLVNAVG